MSQERPLIIQSVVTQNILKRTSCRSFRPVPVESELCLLINQAIATLPPGPFGSPARFKLVAATSQDQEALRGLSTYGFIRNAPAFIIGAACSTGKSLEDFGYQMENLVLFATSLGLGTCWLGGSFSRSNFASAVECQSGEMIPCVCALGHPAEERSLFEAGIRKQIRADERYEWEALFFEGSFGVPLTQTRAGIYATPLEMVRLGPSASNKQPWRVVMDQNFLHFYLQRTRGYQKHWLSRALGVEDMQRVDMGIALSHFGQVAAEMGAKGHWQVQDPGLSLPTELTEYCLSWVSEPV